MLLLVSIFLFSLANIPSELTRSVFYAMLFAVSAVFVIIDAALDRKEQIATITEEPPSSRPSAFERLRYSHLAVLGMLLSSLVFLNMNSARVAIVSAPSFQIVPFAGSPYFLALLSGIAGIIENFFFLGIVLALMEANLSKKLGAAGALLAILASTGVFTFYHFFVYGLENVTATLYVAAFFGMNAVITLSIRSLLVSDFWHFSNNFFLALSKTYSVGFYPQMLVLAGMLFATAFPIALRWKR